jgi:hypothetical protein
MKMSREQALQMSNDPRANVLRKGMEALYASTDFENST